MTTTVRYTVIDGEVIAEKRNGVRKQYVPDPLGSTVALLDNTQTQTDTFSYWPYGEVNTRTGTTPTPFQFVGTLGYYQANSSKTYVRARYLDTQKGRWLTQDPIDFAGGDLNFYRYVGNMNLSYVDRRGKQPSYCQPAPSQTPCDLFKANPNDPTLCQDCCDEKLMGILKKKIRKGIGDIQKCLTDCAQNNKDDPEARSNCIKGCITGAPNLGLQKMVEDYLICCYSICIAHSSSFSPPGCCKDCFDTRKKCLACMVKEGIKNPGSPFE